MTDNLLGGIGGSPIFVIMVLFILLLGFLYINDL